MLNVKNEKDNIMVVIFANQKGGCGKTTLATAFSFYLSNKGHKVTVIDTDEQQSLYQMYLADKGHFDNDFLFEVNYLDMSNKDAVDDVFKSFTGHDNEVAVIDSSGILDYYNLNLASRGDTIVVPFSFDQKTLHATLTWLKSYNHFKYDKNKVIVVANRIKSTVKRDNLLKAKEMIRHEGFSVAINDVADINSINLLTTAGMDKQTHDRTVSVFDEIYNKLFNK